MPAHSPAIPVDLERADRAAPRPFNWLPVLFIAPAALVVFLISIFPVADALVLSLHETRFTAMTRFVGLDNYAALLGDPRVRAATANSVVYTFGSLALTVALSLALALLLNMQTMWQRLLRTIVIVPWVISQTVVALLWAWLINADFGPITHAAAALVGSRPAFLADPDSAMGALIVVNVWASYPQATLLLLAALQTIPRELYEAAHIDGANAARSFRFVTLPLLRPTLMVVLIQLTLLYFNMVTLIYTLTGGGPLDGTETLALRVLKLGFEDWNLGRAAALGLIITAINLLCSLCYIRALGGTDAR
jgi:multiple sugar transport system permease protein